MCLRDLNHVNTLAKGHANFLFFVLCIEAIFLHLVVFVCPMGQLSLSQTVESYSFVVSNQFALNNLLLHL
jgi:hypothetical protein